MTRPTGYLVRMLVFLVVVGAVAGLLSPVLITAFYNNPLLNSLILLVCCWDPLEPQPGAAPAPRGELGGDLPALARPPGRPAVAQAAGADGEHAGDARRARPATASSRFTLSTTAMRSLLDGIASRLDESRELSRYMTGLLIFLGLLGTFWGLLKTVTSVSDVISSMSMGTGDINLMFEQLKSGLARRSPAWAPRSPPACMAWPARWCWASST